MTTAAKILTEVRRLPAENKLRLTWADGHSADFDAAYLRGWCPCAACQGHAALTLQYHPPAANVRVENIEPVGRYAFSVLWSDGHGTGIYRYDFLRDICPCSACGGASQLDIARARKL
ncbi:MAG: DUF971 domain-containing protein [Acidobacteriota bacterium]